MDKILIIYYDNIILILGYEGTATATATMHTSMHV